MLFVINTLGKEKKLQTIERAHNRSAHRASAVRRAPCAQLVLARIAANRRLSMTGGTQHFALYGRWLLLLRVRHLLWQEVVVDRLSLALLHIVSHDHGGLHNAIVLHLLHHLHHLVHDALVLPLLVPLRRKILLRIGCWALGLRHSRQGRGNGGWKGQLAFGWWWNRGRQIDG